MRSGTGLGECLPRNDNVANRIMCLALDRRVWRSSCTVLRATWISRVMRALGSPLHSYAITEWLALGRRCIPVETVPL